MIVSCFVSPTFGGGIARHAREMIAGLAATAGFECRLLGNCGELRRATGFLGGLASLPVDPLPFSALTMDRCWKILGWPPPDWFTRGGDVLYCPAHGRFPTTSTPAVMTVHDVQAFESDLPWSNTAAHRHFRRKWAAWLPTAGRECARILTVSEFSKQRMVDLVGIAPEKIGVVGNGVSRCFFDAGHASRCESGRTPAREDVVVVVGGVRTTKGAADTLAVARELARAGSPLVVQVVGQNDPDWARQAEGMENVQLRGQLSDPELAALLARSVALLFLSPYEGFGIPALEAMAAGTPAVVSNRASLPEIVGEAGIVVEPADHVHIAASLEQLRIDAGMRAAIVAKGASHAAQFTWSNCVARLVDQLRLTQLR
jgi:glycosyltransferase involved in cell wall biosynthesis